MESQFEQFCPLIRALNENDDTIALDRKLHYLSNDIRDVLRGNEQALRDLLFYFNEVALQDVDFASCFALLLSSQQFQELNQDFCSDETNLIRSLILNMLQENYSTAASLKERNIDHFYNSITLLGEFYYRLYKETHPILIMGTSLLELITKHLELELDTCLCDESHCLDDAFARLILSQISLNGPQARLKHSGEINRLLTTVRRCLIEVPTLSSSAKAFFLMSLDLYYCNFRSISDDLDDFYGKILEEHDAKVIENRKITNENNEENATPSPVSFNLQNLKNDFSGLKINTCLNSVDQNRLATTNQEILSRPLSANDRLKSFNEIDSIGTDNGSEYIAKPDLQISEPNSYDEQCDENLIPDPELAPMRSPLTPIATSRADSTSPRKSDNISPTFERHKLTSFDWFEEVENVENGTSQISDNLSVVSFGSNPVSSRDSNHETHRVRQNSTSKRYNNQYRQNTDDRNRRENRNINQRENWRNNSRVSQRNEYRNDYNKRDFDHERDYRPNSSGNNRKEIDNHEKMNDFRRPITRGGSVDSNIKNVNHTRTWYGNRNQDNNDYENFSSYRKNHQTYTNSKIAQLPPRLQKLQQTATATATATSTSTLTDGDNSKRFNDRHRSNNNRNGRNNRDRGHSSTSNNSIIRRENMNNQSCTEKTNDR